MRKKCVSKPRDRAKPTSRQVWFNLPAEQDLKRCHEIFAAGLGHEVSSSLVIRQAVHELRARLETEQEAALKDVLELA